MAKIEGVIRAAIMRLAKREVRAVFRPLKREVRQMSLKLSGLARGMALLKRMAKELRLEEAKPKLEASPEEVKASRLTPERISRLRKKLGISQRELGVLIGASLGSVAMWEKGKFKPKADKKAALVALRKLGKREARNLLSQKLAAPGKQGKAQAKPAVPRAGAEPAKKSARMKKQTTGKQRR
jgi:DNA-binding transcriptional regulator YiaG